ncbi:MAG TPA: NapC/NirT family cytochrome c [Casimicrobiaceae bacterium]|nr:NapC/NirT family cytochrome c [Casimicrobiaceae bacterium]
MRRGDRIVGAGPAAMRGALHWSVILLIALGIAVGIVGVGATTWMVNATSSENFCATACHTMQWAAAAYERSPHFANPHGVRASCADCHIPFESRPATPFQYIFGTIGTKEHDGIHDAIAELRGTISTEEEWDARRPKLAADVEAWLRKTNYVTCKGCHRLDAATGPAADIHADLLKAGPVDCVQCHADVGHKFAEHAAAKP